MTPYEKIWFAINWEKAPTNAEKLTLIYVWFKHGASLRTLSKIVGVCGFKKVWLSRFIRIAPTFTCHFWTGKTDKNLNAVIYIGGGNRYVQDVLWELKYGRSLKPRILINKCGTPDCVNLAHYRLNIRKNKTKKKKP